VPYGPSSLASGSARSANREAGRTRRRDPARPGGWTPRASRPLNQPDADPPGSIGRTGVRGRVSATP
jgi:hypothetical protein